MAEVERLKDILQQQRKMNFVGREKELDFFTSLLTEKSPATHLVYICGPGGQGKTTLLKQFADRCRDKAVPCLQLDCRYIEPHPDSFREAFHAASPFTDGKTVMESIHAHKGTVILLIDTYEKLKQLDDWLRMEFLPELPSNVVTVLSGRLPLSTSWKTDPGWPGITKVFALKELSEQESTQLLSRRNIPTEQIQRIVEYTHGNALALSVVADIFDQRVDSCFDPLDSPDIMRTLFEQFVQEVPSPAHKAALELCALVHVTTEELVEEVLGAQLAHELFNWLMTLTIVEKGPRGIYPHDIARDAIASEMRWRNPEWYRHLHIKTQQVFNSKILKQTGERQREAIFNLCFLHRLNPAIKHFTELQENGSSWQDRMMPQDEPHLIAMVRKFEGDHAAEIFAQWIGHEAAEIWVYRDAEKTPAGVVLRIDLEKINEKTHDEYINALLPHKKKMKIAPGQLMSVFPTWMGRDSYQNVSSVQTTIFFSIIQWYFTPGLAYSMIRCAYPEFWKEVLEYAYLSHVPGLDYEDNGQPYGWYGYDWRERPPLMWLELMGKKEINEDDSSTTTTAGLPVLTGKEFIDTVHEALKHVGNPRKMVGNKLLQSRFVHVANTGEPTDVNLALTLADKLTQTITSLKDAPKDETLHRVLYRTFINPVGSQEQAADFLYMSFSTYRRQVRKGVERVADLLWIEEEKLRAQFIAAPITGN